MENKFSNSVRKFIRFEKARIRGQFSDSKKQEEIILELYKKLSGEVVAVPFVVKKEVKVEVKNKKVTKKPIKSKTK